MPVFSDSAFSCLQASSEVEANTPCGSFLHLLANYYNDSDLEPMIGFYFNMASSISSASTCGSKL
jgi:hypothetical protein